MTVTESHSAEVEWTLHYYIIQCLFSNWPHTL